MSGRAGIAELESPHPLGASLPAMYQEDSFAQRLTAALDEVLAPIFLTLDNQTAYLDPWLAPEDFLEWLAGWVGVALDESWPVERRREAVTRAAQLFRLRGTPGGLADHVQVFTGGSVEIVENGAVSFSIKPGSKVPGSAEGSLLVKVKFDGEAPMTAGQIEQLVEALKPAHLPHRVEIVGGRRGAAKA